MDRIDFSRIQRVVFLVDLHNLHDLPNPNSYISPILSTARRILSFSPLASSLFAYKLFFSSLSPILSTSKVHHLLGKSPTFLSFDRPGPTLQSFSRCLDSLGSVSDPDLSTGHGFSRASLLARSLLQLEHDYGWDPHPQERKCAQQMLSVRSNLVLLFSPTPRSFGFLLEQINLESGGESELTISSDESVKRFVECFDLVKERLGSCDIHLSWVDVNFDYQCIKAACDSRFFDRGIRELGWGFCSTDAIILGSALVPFGLIFPYIGCDMNFMVDNWFKMGDSELVLEIADVNGKPLECKCCDLEVVDLKMITEGLDMESLLKMLISKDSRMHVRELWRSEAGRKVISNPSGIYLLRGVPAGCSQSSQVHTGGEWFPDKVLEMLCTEKEGFVGGKPVWQILLTFLYSRGYWASVSIYHSGDHSIEGILMPFTVNYALLVFAKKSSLNSGQSIARKVKCTKEMHDTPVPAALTDEGKRKKNKMHPNQIQNATLQSFRELVFREAGDVVLEFDLQQIYFSRKYDMPKKLRFLKCWMRQIVESNTCEFILNELKGHLDATGEPETRLVDDVPSSTDDAYQSGSINNDMPVFLCMEDAVAFLRGIPHKIEQGLCSQDKNLQVLAERLVGLSIVALDMQFGDNTNDFISDETGVSSHGKIVNEVSHLLLMKPKDLKLKYKATNSSCYESSNPASYVCSAENKIREYELQILLRMELLRSVVGPNIEDNVRHKIIKEICSLLQFLDINLQGESFGSQNIVEFAERTIKHRYSHCLRDVIYKIYSQMEFDLFEEGKIEAADSLPNSNSDDMKRETRVYYSFYERPNAVPDSEVIRQEKYTTMQQQKLENAHEQRLMKAQERRNRERRISSFTSWMPDLQRVWALKLPKTEKLMRDQLPKPSKRRKKHMATNDRVCETPFMGRKETLRALDDGSCCTASTSKPLSKALFHDNGEFDSVDIS